jgi:hypothetical protein
MARFAAQEPTGTLVQELEVLVRRAVFKPANELVGHLLQSAADRIDAAYQPKPGQVRQGRVGCEIQGLFGRFPLVRDYYYHAGKKQGHYPADAALGLEVGYTPALARILCLEGADEASHQKAELHLAETGGMSISAGQIQRVVQRVGPKAQAWQGREVQPEQCERCDASVFYVSADGTGAPMRPEELAGRRGKQADGTAKTRQVYLGCVFTQSELDDEGHPVRDWESTTCVSSLDSIDQFGPMLRREALRRGMGSALKVVLLIDGAEGLAHMGTLCFKGAVQIVDFFHALEHAGEVLATLLGSKQHSDYESRLHRWADRLLEDQVEALIAESRQEATVLGRLEVVQEKLGYFQRNVARMQYATFRKQGFFIGSGVIEAGCKPVVGARCKQSGMFRGVPGATNVLALRCIHVSRRIAHFWRDRLNQHAARNDTLPLAA